MTTYEVMSGGIRELPLALVGSGMALGVDIYKTLEHNTDLIRETMAPFCVTNQSFHDLDDQDSLGYNLPAAITVPCSGEVQSVHKVMKRSDEPSVITGMICCRVGSGEHNALIDIISTPTLPNFEEDPWDPSKPNTASGQVVLFSGVNNPYHDRVTVTGQIQCAWHSFELDLDYGEGNQSYLSVYMQPNHVTGDTVVHLSKLTMYARPKREGI